MHVFSLVWSPRSSQCFGFGFCSLSSLCRHGWCRWCPWFSSPFRQSTRDRVSPSGLWELLTHGQRVVKAGEAPAKHRGCASDKGKWHDWQHWEDWPDCWMWKEEASSSFKQEFPHKAPQDCQQRWCKTGETHDSNEELFQSQERLEMMRLADRPERLKDWRAVCATERRRVEKTVFLPTASHWFMKWFSHSSCVLS